MTVADKMLRQHDRVNRSPFDSERPGMVLDSAIEFRRSSGGLRTGVGLPPGEDMVGTESNTYRDARDQMYTR